MQISRSLFAVALLVSQAAFAQKPDARIKITTSDDDGLVAVGDSVTFSADIRNLTAQDVCGNIAWRVHTVAFDSPEPKRRAVSIAAGETSQVIPAQGGKLAFVDAEESIFVWARQMGYKGEKLNEPTAIEGKLEIFSYLDGDVIHYKVVGEGHGAT